MFKVNMIFIALEFFKCILGELPHAKAEIRRVGWGESGACLLLNSPL